MADPTASPWEKFSICLPHPYLTQYYAQLVVKGEDSASTYRICCTPHSSKKQTQNQPSFALHSSSLTFSILVKGYDISLDNNTSWARARRSPSTTFAWTSAEPPTVAQLWLHVYSFFTVHFAEESIRLKLVGIQVDLVRDELLAVGLGIAHPAPLNPPDGDATSMMAMECEILLLRSSFWQGAGSPFGPRPVWLPSTDSSSRQPLHTFPLRPTTQTITTTNARPHALHPIRPAKPTPGSIIYSRYIPHLEENFSMTALDYQNPAHLNLFHIWQNDPRVAAGWNKTGAIECHRKYLKARHKDPHVLTILANFDDTPFAYFEVYWAKEDNVGAYYVAGDWDRGRQSLVGNTAFRGPHRAHVWWSSLMHYMFLDDLRTQFVVGEPNHTNMRVLELDSLHGFHAEKHIDFPHKRSTFVKCSREWYFEVCTIGKPYRRKVKVVSARL